MHVKLLGNRPANLTIRELVSRVVSRPAPLQVERRQIPYWQENGWVRTDNIYRGAYHTIYEAFKGEIHEHGSNYFDFFLYQPSPQIRRHSHWVCFQDRGNGWYLVHMAKQPRDLSSGVLTVERLITEAYEKHDR